MSDYIETLWAQFVIESEEHLDLIEPLLLEAEHNTLTRDDLDKLFRSFHSIKGLAKAMDLLGMESVAHRAEDILGLVRDEVIAIDAELADALLLSTDELRQHLQVAESTRQDRAPEDELISRLKSIFKSATEVPGKDSANNSAVASEHLESSGYDALASESESDQLCPTKRDSSGLHSDPDMVAFFAELLQSMLPKFTGLLDPGFTIDSGFTEEIKADLETLIHASSTMDLSQLADAFTTILNLLSDKEAATKICQESLIDSLMVLVDLIQFIENEVKQECGISPLVARLRVCTAEMIDRLFLDLSKQLRHVSEDETSRDAAEIMDFAVQTAEKTCALNYHLHALNGGESSNKLLLTVSEVCNQIHLGHAVPESDLIHLLLNAVCVAEKEYQQVVENENEFSKSVDWSALHEKIWDVIKQQRSVESDNELLSFKKLSEKIKISAIFEDCLSKDNIQLLQDGIEDGEKVYEVLVNLEESEAFTTRFLQWVEKNVQLVSNSTVFIEDKPWSHCLLLTKQLDDQLRTSVKELDPERQFMKMETCTELVKNPNKEAPATSNAAAKELSMLRVNSTTLDQFMSQIGEMVSIRGMFNHTLQGDDTGTTISDLKEIGSNYLSADIYNEHFSAPLEAFELQLARFEQVDQKLNTILNQLQESALALRVVPMETVFKRLPRPVRNLAQMQKKQVKLEITGQDVRIDKGMVEVLSDPLMHMVRNSVDHGIELPEERLAAGKPEQAVVGLDAKQQGNIVKVTITDDGRGINVEAVKSKALEKGLASEEELSSMCQEEIMQFIFAPGFSTAEQITETSGRGVGMDVALTNVIKIGGDIKVESESGKGSCFTLQLPLSAAIQDTVLVKASGQMMAIPERYVTEMIEMKISDVQTMEGRQVIVLRDSILPVYNLGLLLGYQAVKGDTNEKMAVAVLSDGKKRIGVVIDRSFQRQELFIKDIQEHLATVPCVSGAAILGDGNVVLILEVEELFSLAGEQRKTELFALSDIDPGGENDIDYIIGEFGSEDIATSNAMNEQRPA